MKKRYVLKMFSAAALSLSLLAGCTNGDSANRGSIGDREEDPTPTEEAAPVETDPTPTPEPDIEPEPVAEDPEYRQLEFTSYTIGNNYYDKDLEMNLVSMKADIIELLDDDHPQLSAAINEYNDRQREDIEGEPFETLKENAEEMISSGFGGMELYDNRNIYIERADSVVTSIINSYDNYTGGAHGMYGVNPAVYDSLSGDILNIDDVLEGDKILELPGILAEKLLDEYDKEIFNDPEDLASTISQIYMDNGDLQFSLGYEGLSVYFNVYTLGPYASGMQIVTLKYEDYPGLVKEKYTECASDYFISSYALTGTLPHSDKSFYAGAASDDDYSMSLYYELDGATYTDKFYGYDADIWIATIGHINYMYVDVLHENDYESLRIYSLDENNPGFVAEFDGGFYNRVPADPFEFRIYERGDLMSTYDMYKYYYIGRNGEPVSSDPFYIIDMGEYSQFYLNPKKDMAVSVRENEDSSTYTEKTIKPSDKMYFYATDNKSWVEFKLDDGGIVRFELDQPIDYPQSIDGVDINELFDRIMFAG